MSTTTGQDSTSGDTKSKPKPKRGERKPLGKTFKNRGHEVAK